jgi:hypothetical protein
MEGITICAQYRGTAASTWGVSQLLNHRSPRRSDRPDTEEDQKGNSSFNIGDFFAI